MVVNDLSWEDISSFAFSKRHTWQNAFHMSHTVDLSDLPYFRLRDFFNSDGSYILFFSIEVSTLNRKRCKEGI
jgi:hypothetical protein